MGRGFHETGIYSALDWAQEGLDARAATMVRKRK